jgi:opacity protein-like surface antigen
MVHAVASGGAQGVKVSISETKVAYGVGGGVDIGIGKRVAVLSDIRLISPRDLNWCARFSTGLAIRFN